MYRILVSAMAYDDGKSGISDYINNVVAQLARANYVDVIVSKADAETFAVRGDNVRFIVRDGFSAKPLLNSLWHLFILPYTIRFDRYDFVFLPAGNRRLFSRCPIYTVATVHDLSQFNVPKKYDALRMFYVARVIPFFLRKVDSVCAVSQSTKRDIMKHYKMPESKIFVNYNGYDRERFDNGADDEQDVRGHFGLQKEYILYVARIEHPGKNHLALIKAYELLPEEVTSKVDLVFAGSDWFGADIVKEYAAKSSKKDNIRFLGFVADEHLAGLYRAAHAYCFPSLCEGFGIPLIEAMACGTPVACSNGSSLSEIGGEAVVTFDPGSVEDISRGVLRLLSDKELCATLVEKGYEQIGKFSWSDHARRIVEQYEKDNRADCRAGKPAA